MDDDEIDLHLPVTLRRYVAMTLTTLDTALRK